MCFCVLMCWDIQQHSIHHTPAVTSELWQCPGDSTHRLTGISPARPDVWGRCVCHIWTPQVLISVFTSCVFSLARANWLAPRTGKNSLVLDPCCHVCFINDTISIANKISGAERCLVVVKNKMTAVTI